MGSLTVVIWKSSQLLHTKAAEEPSATRVSMLGALCVRPLKPEMKNFLLIIITMTVR